MITKVHDMVLSDGRLNVSEAAGSCARHFQRTETSQYIEDEKTIGKARAAYARGWSKMNSHANIARMFGSFSEGSDRFYTAIYFRCNLFYFTYIITYRLKKKPVNSGQKQGLRLQTRLGSWNLLAKCWHRSFEMRREFWWLISSSKWPIDNWWLLRWSAGPITKLYLFLKKDQQDHKMFFFWPTPARKKTIVHKDNARVQTRVTASHTAMAKFYELHQVFFLLPHPPYFPDLALSDFHLFPKLKTL